MDIYILKILYFHSWMPRRVPSPSSHKHAPKSGSRIRRPPPNSQRSLRTKTANPARWRSVTSGLRTNLVSSHTANHQREKTRVRINRVSVCRAPPAGRLRLGARDPAAPSLLNPDRGIKQGKRNEMRLKRRMHPEWEPRARRANRMFPNRPYPTASRRLRCHPLSDQDSSRRFLLTDRVTPYSHLTLEHTPLTLNPSYLTAWLWIRANPAAVSWLMLSCPALSAARRGPVPSPEPLLHPSCPAVCAETRSAWATTALAIYHPAARTTAPPWP